MEKSKDVNGNWVVYVVLIAIALLLVWVALKMKKKQGETTEIKEEVKPTLTSVFPLKKGSNGLEVKQLQAWLLKNHGVKLSFGTDGDFGNETTKYVKSYINKDGIVTEEWFKTNKVGELKVG